MSMYVQVYCSILIQLNLVGGLGGAGEGLSQKEKQVKQLSLQKSKLFNMKMEEEFSHYKKSITTDNL